jgi:hypothetical protein
MDSGLYIVLAAVVSVLGGVGTLLVGRRIDKAHGIPNDLESKLIAEMKEYADALEANNGRLEAEIAERHLAEAACVERLEEAELREAAILRRMDDLEAQNARLLARLGEFGG